MKLDLDYNIKPEDNPDKVSAIQFTVNTIQSAINTTHTQGLEGQKRRIFGRLQRKMDAAVDENKTEIELEEAEKDMIRAAFKEAKFHPSMSKYVIVLEDELEKI